MNNQDILTKMTEMFDGLITNKNTVTDAIKLLEESGIRKWINMILYHDSINTLAPYTEEDYQFLYMLINITQYIFNYSGESTTLTDDEFDKLNSILQSHGQDIITVKKNVDNVEYHKYPHLRGTLKKTYFLTDDEVRTNPSRKYLSEWVKSMESKYYNSTGKQISLDNEEVYVFPKWDGVSGIFEFSADGKLERILTRGFTETNEAENITHVLPKFKRQVNSELYNQPYGLKTEILMTEDNLEYYNKKYDTDYKNSRSIVSAIINSDEYDEEKSSLLCIQPLRICDENGNQELATEALKFAPYVKCRLKDREIIRKFANSHRYVDGLRCDGAVIYIINPEIQQVLGRENHKNNFEVAYKFTEETTYSEIVDIEFQMGLFGRVSPVAVIKPVKLKGNTIDHISLGSMGRFKSLKLRKGDKVKILYDIIPYLTLDDFCDNSKNYNDIIEPPHICPICFKDLHESETGELLYCTNPECDCVKKGIILNFLNKMNIENLSYGVLDKLYEHGYLKSIKDIYSLDKKINEISNIPGLGYKTMANIIGSIDEHRTTTDYDLLGSIGIEGVSKKTFKVIFDMYSLDEFMEIVEDEDYSKLTKVPSIKDKKAKKIMKNIKSNKKLINFLINELNIIHNDTNNNLDTSFKVCFTKVRDKKLEEEIMHKNGEVSDSLTRDVKYLVVPNKDTESSKINKAQKYGIEIITIDELKNILSTL